MEINYVPVLEKLRELYSMPRGMERFQAYIQMMTEGTDDLVRPMTAANPMAREHALPVLDHLLTIDAEGVAERAVRVAGDRLRHAPGTLMIALVLMDDVHGGWTNYYLSEAGFRFQPPLPAHRRTTNGITWTSELATAEKIDSEMRAAVYRVAHADALGQARTLTQMLIQEGRAAIFSDTRPTLTEADVARVRPVIEEYAEIVSVDDYPVAFACMYGDAGAVACGYAPLGLPPRAGFEVALAIARERGEDPVAATRYHGDDLSTRTR